MADVAASTGQPNPAPAAAGTAACYRLDPGHSRFTVQAFADGLLRFLAHSPTFAVRDFAGEVRLDPTAVVGGSLLLTARADSLDLLDQVSAADRQDIQGRMRGEVLETPRNPEIRLEATITSAAPVAAHDYQVQLDGGLTLHGAAQPQRASARLSVHTDGVRLTGEAPLYLSHFGIRPVTALGGGIRLNDRLRVAFDLVAWNQT
jgi:polyisoprenoid-binding protein YceI